MSLLELDRVSFGYARSILVLEHLSFSIKKGTFTTILGMNGSGKSTLLKLICGILTPHQGEIYLNQSPYRIFNKRSLSQKLAYFPQNISPLFSISVLDFVLLGRAPFLTGFGFESEHDIHIAHQSLQDTDTFQFKNRAFHTLSGGEKQRVLLAKALTQTPEILLLDEPTTHLDIKHQLELLSLLKTLYKKREMTILAVFHDFQLASELSDELIFLKDHRLEDKGTPQSLLTEENIRRMFGVDVAIDQNPYTKNLRVTYKSPLWDC